MSHHHHHHHHHSPPCCCSNTCFCCSSSMCCSSNSTPNPISSSSSSSTSDLLLQTLLLIQSQSQPPPPPHPTFLKPQPNKIPHHHRLHSQPKPKPKQHDYDDDDDADAADPSLHLLHSLIRRVAALESSLSKISPSPHQKQPQQRGHSSLKHAAAATIQRCFRRFLARRSRTLRDLSHLASIKSQAAALRSSLSDRTHLRSNPKALSRRAMDLLFHLDSIQSSDPMIREGKRSVSKQLVRISEFVDKVLIREKEDEVEELDRTIDRARRVSFAAEENGDGDDNVFDDLLERNPEEEEVQGFYVPLSDDGKESLEVVRHDRFTTGGLRMSNGGLGLAAPLPVKMEPRRTVSLKKVANEEED